MTCAGLAAAQGLKAPRPSAGELFFLDGTAATATIPLRATSRSEDRARARRGAGGRSSAGHAPRRREPLPAHAALRGRLLLAAAGLAQRVLARAQGGAGRPDLAAQLDLFR